MKPSIELKDQIIFRRFKGKVSEKDMLDSWLDLFDRFDDLSPYKGIITTFEDPPDSNDESNGGAVVQMSQMLIKHKDKLGNLRVAIVLDHPIITKAVMVDHYVKHVQVRPFVTEEAALRWINP
jgi:hypothetical protein